MSDLLKRIEAAQRDAGERVVMESLEAKGLGKLVGRNPRPRKMTTSERHAADAGVGYDPRCAPPTQLPEIESVADVEECIRRFQFAWQLPITNEEIKPASNDLLTATDWALKRIAALEMSMRLTDAECDNAIKALATYDWTGLTRDDVRLIFGTIWNARGAP